MFHARRADAAAGGEVREVGRVRLDALSLARVEQRGLTGGELDGPCEAGPGGDSIDRVEQPGEAIAQKEHQVFALERGRDVAMGSAELLPATWMERLLPELDGLDQASIVRPDGAGHPQVADHVDLHRVGADGVPLERALAQLHADQRADLEREQATSVRQHHDDRLEGVESADLGVPGDGTIGTCVESALKRLP